MAFLHIFTLLFVVEIGQQSQGLSSLYLFTITFYCLSASNLSRMAIACRQKFICLPQHPRLILWAMEWSKFLRNHPSHLHLSVLSEQMKISMSALATLKMVTQQWVEDGQWKSKQRKKPAIIERNRGIKCDSWSWSTQTNKWSQLKKTDSAWSSS